MNRALALFALLLLGACAGTFAGVPPKTEGIRSGGVISAIGDKFYVHKVGLTVFGNDAKEFPAESWGIDEAVVGKTRALLSRRFDLRPVTYQRAAFAAATSNSWNAIGDLVRNQVSPQGLDAYVVITKGGSMYGRTNQALHGIGLVQGGGVVGRDYYWIHALYEINVIDGHEFRSLGRSFGSLAEEPPLTNMIRGPNREVEASWWPASLEAGSNPKLKGGVIDLIDQSLPNTLQRMQLAG